MPEIQLTDAAGVAHAMIDVRELAAERIQADTPWVAKTFDGQAVP